MEAADIEWERRQEFVEAEIESLKQGGPRPQGSIRAVGHVRAVKERCFSSDAGFPTPLRQLSRVSFVRQLDRVGFSQKVRLETGGVESRSPGIAQQIPRNRDCCIDLDANNRTSMWGVVRSARWEHAHVYVARGSEMSRVESTTPWSKCTPRLSLLVLGMVVRG